LCGFAVETYINSPINLATLLLSACRFARTTRVRPLYDIILHDVLLTSVQLSHYLNPLSISLLSLTSLLPSHPSRSSPLIKSIILHHLPSIGTFLTPLYHLFIKWKLHVFTLRENYVTCTRSQSCSAHKYTFKLHYTILYYTILYYTILYYTTLH
jgi:hypothetical protein